MFKKPDDVSLGLPVNPYKFSNFRPDYDQETIEWFDNIREDLQRKIDITLSNKLYHSLVLDIADLDEHIRRTPLEIQHVAHLIAKTKKKEYETKRDIKKAEALAYFSYISGKDKKPPQAEIDAFIATDLAVTEAHKVMAEVQESLIILQSYAEALHSKQIMLAGMQGRYRDVTKAEMQGMI